jgi:hypothetical protein
MSKPKVWKRTYSSVQLEGIEDIRQAFDLTNGRKQSVPGLELEVRCIQACDTKLLSRHGFMAIFGGSGQRCSYLWRYLWRSICRSSLSLSLSRNLRVVFALAFTSWAQFACCAKTTLAFTGMDRNRRHGYK